MNILPMACCALLLSSCTAFFSSSSEIEESPSAQSPSTSFSSRREETNETLRRLWLQLEQNNARVYSENGLIGAFLGEAVYWEETSGMITVGEQGVFSFCRGASIVVEDFVAPGKLSSLRGLSLLARSGPGAFIPKEDAFALRSTEEAFARDWFALVDEPRPLSALEDLRLFVEEKRVDVLARFRNGDEERPYEEVSYRIESIGDVRCQETENFLSYPPTVLPRVSFDEEILSYFEDRLGSKEAIPFPNRVSAQFADARTPRGIECYSHGSSFWSTYPNDLMKAGFALDEEGRWAKTFRIDRQVRKAFVEGKMEKEGESLLVSIAMEPVECVGFAFINERLNRSPFPPFPESLNVTKTWIVDQAKDRLEIEIEFRTLEGAVEYFQDAYLPLLAEREFLPEENQSQSYWRWSRRGEKGEVAMELGGSLGEGEVCYRVLFKKTPEI